MYTQFRKTTIINCAAFFVAGLLAASALGQNANKVETKYWIVFTDKPAVSSKYVAPHLTDAALNRRALRGSALSNERDAPVSPVYVDALRNRGIEPIRTSRWINAISVTLTQAQRDEVSQLPFVRTVRSVARISTLNEAPTLPMVYEQPGMSILSRSRIDYGQSQTQLQAINAIDPIEQGYIGTGITLGFLDTEFGDFQHPVFAAMVNDDRLMGQMNFTEGAQTSRHGLSVASTAVGFAEGSLVGPGYGASVFAATTEYAPTETNQEEDNFVAGMEWLESQGVDVVNTSLGYSTFDSGQNSYTTADLDGDTGLTTIVADVAASMGVVVVTSAGNEGCSSPSSCWYYITTPADADSAITVGSVNANGIKSGFSSFGPTADGRFKPDVAAIGEQVYIGNGTSSYVTSQGTSFSSPLTAGVVCQILQANPKLSPIDVRDILRSTASQATNPDNSLGYGVIDAAAAVAAALAHPTSVDAESPDQFAISAPYPNPATTELTITIRSSSARTIRIDVFDSLGRLVGSPIESSIGNGVTTVRLPTTHLASGVYHFTAKSPEWTESRTFTVMR